MVIIWTTIQNRLIEKVKKTFHFVYLIKIFEHLICKNPSDRKLESELQDQYISVKGNLKQSYRYWMNTIKRNDTVLYIIQEDYKLHFVDTPSEARFQNNK